MRQSLLPIIGALLILVVGLLLIRPTVDQGQGGPAVAPGPFMMPKPTWLRRHPGHTESMALSGSTAARLESGLWDDGTWQVIVVSGGDDEPTTRAAMRAVGESLFAAGCIAVMDPLLPAGMSSRPLGLPADRVLRITTRNAPAASDVHGAWEATVEFRLWEPRLPAGHPASTLQIPPALASAVCVVEHRGRPAANATGSWPERWAATGREITKAAFASLLPPGGVRVPAIPLAPGWEQALPPPPGTPELHWDACFEHEFVRGWNGAIVGRSVATADGKREPSEAPLLRLLGMGKWTVAENRGEWQQWTREVDGQREWFGLHPAATGWEATMWIERDPAPPMGRWLATPADPQAREHLRRALAVPRLAPALRQQAEAALR